ncbi:MAG: hypothetical protein ACR2MF_03920 [Chthoniobacterales bacterium]
MRNLILIVVMLLCGCGPATRPNPFSQEVIAGQGTERLLLNYDRTRQALFSSENYEFRCLAWQTKASSNWSDKLVISKAAFQGTYPKERWVTGIDSFNPAKGVAIIRVAEADAPVNSKTINYIYSWREWNLLTNGEVRLLRICKTPFEKY